ncbi:Hypothetical predicted protein [Pelobates cultripes]|uniref:Helix-turn-helix domain-containing protein n=1 Tax=Pelobates cultripes TaxID=61616 RepID=A0AAD1RIZ3_PELCU|nr:Hypothetical predicted protein [Pelobates cultripes]
MYTKPTDRNTLLHYESAHPKHVKDSLPFSQFLRVIRNNSDIIRCEEQIQQMYNKFAQRGYTRVILDKALRKARDHMAGGATRPWNNKARIPFPMTYNASTTQICHEINTNWHLMENDKSLPESFHNKPLFSYKNNKSLRDLLVQTDPIQSYLPENKNTTNNGCWRIDSEIGEPEINAHAPGVTMTTGNAASQEVTEVDDR